MTHRPHILTLTLALLTLALLGAASAQVGIAYAHVSLSIRFGDGNPASFEVSGSIYPSLATDTFCIPGARCATGMATPLGYVYDPNVFDHKPEYHGEEIHHIKQWEALGPGFLIAYLMTGGEPFEPYPTRGVIPAAASTSERWDFGRMWVPEPEMEGTFPQFRIAWGGGDKPSTRIYPGYTDLARDVIASIRGNPTPSLPNEPVLATLELTPYLAIANLATPAPDGTPSASASDPNEDG